MQAKFQSLGGIQPVMGSDFMPMSEAEISKLEKQLGVSLPGSYRNFLLQYGASAFGESVDFRPMESLPPHVSSDGKGHFAFFYGPKKKVYGDTYSLAAKIRVFSKRMPESMIPIGGDGAGDQICLGIRDPDAGRVYYWDHQNDWDEEDYEEEHGSPMPAALKRQTFIWLRSHLRTSSRDWRSRLTDEHS